MATFSVTFSNVLLTLLYLIPGFLLCKYKKVRADHLSTVSVILKNQPVLTDPEEVKHFSIKKNMRIPTVKVNA